MKKILTTALIVLFVLTGPAVAKNVQYTLEWNANSEANMAGYKVYIRLNDNPYDYNDPKDPVCTIVDGQCWVDPANKTCEYVTPLIPIPDGEKTTVCFVCRAYDTDNDYSGDSNEVCGDPVDLRPIDAPVVTAAVYNSQTRTIDFTFTQNDPESRVTRYALYMAPSDVGPWDNKVAESTEKSISYQVLEDGSHYFVVVSYTDEVYSENSNIVSVRVKEHPNKPVLRIKMRIQ